MPDLLKLLNRIISRSNGKNPKNDTSDPSKEILSILRKVPQGRLEALLASGLLEDLCAVNAGFINRKNFREFIGLGYVPISIEVELRSGVVLQPPEEGWQLKKDYTSKLQNLNLRGLNNPFEEITLGLADFFCEGENEIPGEELVKRSKIFGGLGEIHMQKLLEKRHAIPKKWQRFFLLFPETIWLRLKDRTLWVPCTVFRNDGWEKEYGKIKECFTLPCMLVIDNRRRRPIILDG